MSGFSGILNGCVKNSITIDFREDTGNFLSPCFIRKYIEVNAITDQMILFRNQKIIFWIL